MRIMRTSSLVRELDPRVPSNAFVMAVMAVAAIAVGVWQLLEGEALVRAGDRGLGSAFGVLAAWAVAREIEPDHPWAANLAAPLALVLSVVHRPDAIGAFALVVAARLLVRSRGRRPIPLDYLGIVLLATVAARLPTGVGPGLVLAVAPLVDAGLGYRDRYSVVAPVVGLAAVAAAAVLLASPSGFEPAPTSAQWSLLLLGSSASMGLARGEPLSTGDLTRERLSGRRLRVARLAVLLGGFSGVVFAGGTGIMALAPVWAAFLGGAAAALGRHARSVGEDREP